MCVQPKALVPKVIQYIVLYCLTPPPFHRYSCFILCPPYPAQDGGVHETKPNAHFAEGKGIRLVNRAAHAATDYWPLTAGHCFSQGVHVA